MCGQVGSAACVALASAALVLALLVLLHPVELSALRVAATLGVVLFASCAFAGLGLALSLICRTGQTAPAVSNALLLPLAFASGVFSNVDAVGPSVVQVTAWLPLRPFIDALTQAAQAGSAPSVLDAPALMIVGAWGLAGLATAICFDHFEPRAR